MAATNYYRRTYEINNENIKSRNNCYIPELDDDSELWSPFLNLQANVVMYQEINLDYYLNKYWKRINGGEFKTYSPDIIVGARVYFKGNVYECSYYRQSSRLSSFVKLSLPQDRYAHTSTRTELEWKVFFGEIVLFFANKCDGKSTSILIHLPILFSPCLASNIGF